MAVEGYESGVRHVWALLRRQVRRTALFVIGLVIVLFGVALLVLPGPGGLMILLGLSVWSIEFAWARRLRRRVQSRLREVGASMRRRRS
jgi:uncharacterized protein (TIGR02611 family)